MRGRDFEIVELRIAILLRYGVLAAGVLMLAGWVLHLDFHHNPFAAFHEYAPAPLGASLQVAWRARDWSVLLSYAGLFVLISLPVLRVLMTGLLFILQGERKLAVIAFVVLAVLALSFSLGFEL